MILHNFCINKALNQISLKYDSKKIFLDIGCGDGIRTMIFASKQRTLYATDMKNWLNKPYRTRIKFKKNNFLQTQIPYENGFFDLILCFDVIEHLKNSRDLLSEIRRLLKKDGALVISTLNRHRFFGLLLILQGLRKFTYSTDPKQSNIESSQHHKEYTVSELVHLLNQYKLKTVKTHRLFYGLTSGYGICRLFSLPLFHNIILECQKIYDN